MRAVLGAAALAALTSCTPASERSAYAGPPGERQPVILELFTSEGCSSCPPADTLLASLSKGQPVPGAEVIALELHVDYWNYLGWSDPFSSAANSARQRAYGASFGQRGIYTPQLVVDGHAELLGSDTSGAKEAILTASRAPKARITIAQNQGKIAVTVADVPGPHEPASVWLAITEEGLHTDVPRGENAGSRLGHGPIVRSLSRLGAASPSFSGEVTPALDPAWKKENVRAVAFVQRDGSLQILGAGVASMK
ncbi:MAG: DUF1223 domain-containing protein [Byssovorax sp.]